MSPHRTLVTGATGLLGNNLVRLLLDRGHDVRALVRRPDDRSLAGLDLDCVAGDVRDFEAVRRACRGVTAVIHAAAMVRIGRTGWDETRAINTVGTGNVADAARDAGARLVHVSTCDCISPGTPEAPGDENMPQAPCSDVPYVVTKREGEQHILRAATNGLDAVVVNPAYLLGPWDWKPSSGEMLLQVAEGRALLAPRGWISLCDVRDVAEGVLAALDRGQRGRRYILAGANMTMLDAWRRMARTAGVRGPIGTIRPLALGLGGLGGDLWGRLTGREPVINSAAVEMAQQVKTYSSQRARDELDYRNRPVEDTLRDAWSWFREYGYAGANGRRVAERAG